MCILRKDQRVQILACLVEGNGIRATARLCNVNKSTVNQLALDLGEGCAVLHDELMRNLRVDLVQVDEQWSFVKRKNRKVSPDDFDAAVVGDQWTHVAVDVVHKVIISFFVGKRTYESACTLVKDLRSRVSGRFQVTSDGYRPYVDAFSEICGDSVDFSQLVKRYECDEREAKGQPLGRKRYIGSEHTVITGSPDPKEISTSGIERVNLSARMENSRLERKTIRHSKVLRHHQAAAALYYVYFNLCRVHDTLKTTPAVALGVTTRIWSLGELIDAALERRPRVDAAPAPAVREVPALREVPLVRKAPSVREVPSVMVQPRLRLILGGLK